VTAQHSLGEPAPLSEDLSAEDLSADDAALEDGGCDLQHAVQGFERRHIMRVLARTGGNREAAAKLLGLSPATLYRHLARVGLKGYRVPEGS
jgi:DNA-binding NtrC family response regulator